MRRSKIRDKSSNVDGKLLLIINKMDERYIEVLKHSQNTFMNQYKSHELMSLHRYKYEGKRVRKER